MKKNEQIQSFFQIKYTHMENHTMNSNTEFQKKRELNKSDGIEVAGITYGIEYIR